MAARAGTQDAGSQGLSREVKIVSAVVVLGVVMSLLDTTIVSVALDTLSRDLRSPLSTIQWVSTGYLLSLAMVIPLAGWLSERFGSKRVWMVSVAVFAIGSALCGIAWSAGSLIFFRVFQGFGGGLIMPRVAWRLQGGSPVFQLREHVSLMTNHPELAWVNPIEVWARRAVDVSTGQVRVKAYGV